MYPTALTRGRMAILPKPSPSAPPPKPSKRCLSSWHPGESMHSLWYARLTLRIQEGRPARQNAEMGPQTRTSILSKFRSPPAGSASLKRVLVVLEMLCRTLTDLQQVPLVVNFDISSPEGAPRRSLAFSRLSRSCDSVYVHQAVRASAAAANYRPGSVVNVCCSDEDVQRLKQYALSVGRRVADQGTAASKATSVSVCKKSRSTASSDPRSVRTMPSSRSSVPFWLYPVWRI
jgi:superfamily II DNA/RNA helicase